MKHAKRMVLVPEDTLHRYEQKQRLETSPLMASMMHKDTDMSNILQRPDIDDSEKQRLYYANMERYLDLRRQKDSQIPTVRVAPESKEVPKEREQLADTSIVEPIPRTIRPRATALLNQLKGRPDVISWDKSGQVSVEGKPIPQSNISDLINDAVRARKNFNPTGSQEFFRALSKMNMPRDLVRNEERWMEAQRSDLSKDEDKTPVVWSPSSHFQTSVKRPKKKKKPSEWHNY